MTALAGEDNKILMVAVPTFHTGKAVVQIAAIKTTITNIPLTCKPDPHMLHPHERKS